MPNLADIMSEQYIESLGEKENNQHQSSPSTEQMTHEDTNNIVSYCSVAQKENGMDDTFEQDLALAIQLSKELNGTAYPATNETEISCSPSNTSKQEEEDYLMAQQLQLELEEEALGELALRQNHGPKAHEKVRLDYVHMYPSSEDYARHLYYNGPSSNADTIRDLVSGEAAGSQRILYTGEEDEEEILSASSDDAMFEDFYDDIYDEYEQDAKLKVQGANSTKPVLVTKHDGKLNSRRHAYQIEQFDIASGDMSAKNVPTHAFNYLRQKSRKIQSRKVQKKNKEEDFSTSDSVMDKRTRLILYKWMNAGVLEVVEGTLDGGKESKIYYATSFCEDFPASTMIMLPSATSTVGDPSVLSTTDEVAKEVVIKVFRTTLDMFRNRKDYMKGDFRYRHKLKHLSTKKLIQLWAEKEMVNLKRLRAHGIQCPTPLVVKNHVLIMTFIGKDGKAAPKLKDVELSQRSWASCYIQCLKMMRTMFHKCGLVHADLSEFNILYFRKTIYFIDVSQAVESLNPDALKFLRQDCTNVHNFFQSKINNKILSIRQMFEFIIDPDLSKEQSPAWDQYLLEVCLSVQKEDAYLMTGEECHAEELEQSVFLSCFLPTTLHSIEDPFSSGTEEVIQQYQACRNLVA